MTRTAPPFVGGTVLDNRQVTPTSWLLRLMPEGGVFDFVAGQWVLLRHAETAKPRAYSILSTPWERDGLTFVIQRLGPASSYFCSLQAGERVDVQGPLGNYRLRPPERRSTVFVALGVGIASLRPMLYQRMRHDPGHPVSLVLYADNESELILLDEFRALATRPDLALVPAVKQATAAWNGEQGPLIEVLRRHVPDPQQVDLYICGFARPTRVFREECFRAGFDRDHLFHEYY